MTERRSDRVQAPVSLPGIGALEAVVEGSVVPRDSPDFEVFRKPAGALLGDVYERLDSHGLTIAAGACPSVGIAGLTLGGGFGVLGRRYGLTSDQLVGARVVLADGRVVDCDEHRAPSLFWALRGAG